MLRSDRRWILRGTYRARRQCWAVCMTRTGFVCALEEILALKRRTLREDSSRDSLEEWKSLADVQIFRLFEREFGIEPSEQRLSAESVGDLLRIVESSDVPRIARCCGKRN